MNKIYPSILMGRPAEFSAQQFKDLVPWCLVWRQYGFPHPARESWATVPCCVKQSELWKTFEALDNVVIFSDKPSLSLIGKKKDPNYRSYFCGSVVKALALRAHVRRFDSLQGQKEFFVLGIWRMDQFVRWFLLWHSAQISTQILCVVIEKKITEKGGLQYWKVV